LSGVRDPKKYFIEGYLYKGKKIFIFKLYCHVLCLKVILKLFWKYLYAGTRTC
jgi:hypothetical protein